MLGLRNTLARKGVAAVAAAATVTKTTINTIAAADTTTTPWIVCPSAAPYLSMTGEFRQWIQGYATKINPLQQRKTELLKGSPVKGAPRKRWSATTRLLQPTDSELNAFRILQDEFRSPRWLSHHHTDRQLYITLDSSKEQGHGAVIFHVQPE
jgi:uncharacterized protein YycO